MGKWGTTLYGFVEADIISDSTQSFNETAGNATIFKPDTYQGDHSRMQFGVRNSRIGFKLSAPEVGGVKASAVVEMDFLGTQPTNASEQAFFSSPLFRVRHFALKVETPVVDLLMGQYWQLFGWQSTFQPNTVQIQGVPGEVYSRGPQFRLSKTIKAGDAAFEVAVAASRPPQRNSGVPDGQAGLKFTHAGWKGVHTTGATGTAADGIGIGVSGVARRLILADFVAPVNDKTHRQGATGYGISVDGLIPVISGTVDHRANALSLTGSFVAGTGIADLYSGLTGGVAFPTLPNPDMIMPAPTYTADIDNGIVTFDSSGNMHTINWQSYIVGIQYYLPIIDGRTWVAANYSRMKSTNALRYTPAAGDAKIFDRSFWWDVNLFFDATKAVRFGAEYSSFNQTYGDGKDAKNERFQFSGFFIF